MTKAADTPQRNAPIPVTTIEEIPVLSAKQREDLGASLAEAERDIDEGRGAPYDTKDLQQHFMRGFHGRLETTFSE